MKPGDKVKLIENNGMAAQIGATATIGPKGRYIDSLCGDLLDVIWDDTPLRSHQADEGYYSSKFELIYEENIKTQPKPQLKVDYMGITREICGAR